MPPRAIVLLVIGAVMCAVGAYVAGRLLATGRPVTQALWLDAAFALFFIVRGSMNVLAARRAMRAAGPRA